MPLSRNLGTLTSWKPLGHSRPVMGLLLLWWRVFVTSRTAKADLYSCSTSVHQRNICLSHPGTADGRLWGRRTGICHQTVVSAFRYLFRRVESRPRACAIVPHLPRGSHDPQLSHTVSCVANEVGCCHDLSNETLL